MRLRAGMLVFPASWSIRVRMVRAGMAPPFIGKVLLVMGLPLLPAFDIFNIA